MKKALLILFRFFEVMSNSGLCFLVDSTSGFLTSVFMTKRILGARMLFVWKLLPKILQLLLPTTLRFPFQSVVQKEGTRAASSIHLRFGCLQLVQANVFFDFQLNSPQRLHSRVLLTGKSPE